MKAISRLSEILESEVNSYGASSRLVPISLTLIIPKNICGLIVGKKGETIKELRVQSGAQIALAAEVGFLVIFIEYSDPNLIFTSYNVCWIFALFLHSFIVSF